MIDIPRTRIAVTLALSLAAGTALAHVPFIEEEDWSEAKPFVVKDISQSKALYGWVGAADDVDWFSMTAAAGEPIYLRALVPLCDCYRDFHVTYALTGPGLPAPTEPLPFALPEGHGAVVVHDTAATPDRETNYEPFSARWYWQEPELRVTAPVAGTYRMAVWQAAGLTGDYVAVIGQAERFGAADLARAATGTVKIRRGRELHARCELKPEVSAPVARGRGASGPPPT